MRVVIVDDQADFRAAARELLEKRGHVVVAEAGNQDEALAAMNAAEPDVVLMDIRLGDESGFDVTRALTSVRPEVPVVLMSIDSATSPDEVRASGARAYVSKNRLHVTDLAALARREPEIQ
ncbi:MAG TPA: response regulator [Gaiellaceae bacterium]|jgi:DNA-binding NarL/FixJ family response regulator